MARTGTTARRVAAGIAIAGAVGLGLLAVPSGAGAQPELPPVAPEELVDSVLAADPGPFGGTVELDNALGLPPLPELPQAADGTSTARVWSDGEGRGRLSIPTDFGERTVVADGETLWSWTSADRTVVRTPSGAGPAEPREPTAVDPTVAATEALAALRPTSEITVDGTAEVAGRPAYELVLAPAPTERTLLREIRIAVDAQERVPLRLTVLGIGSTDPALQVGFTDLEFGPQDPALFTFTPPPGATVEDRPHGDATRPPDGSALPTPTTPSDGSAPTVVGDGWDTVLVSSLPAGGTGLAEGGFDPSVLGTPVSGAWGSGTLISTAVAGAILTDDGRVAVGAVPEQVLAEALSR